MQLQRGIVVSVLCRGLSLYAQIPAKVKRVIFEAESGHYGERRKEQGRP